MRVAFVVEGFPRLSETFILNQITGLRDLGVDVDIYALGTWESGVAHPEVAACRLLEHTYFIPASRGGTLGTVQPAALRDLLVFARNLRLLWLRRAEAPVQSTFVALKRALGSTPAVWRALARGLSRARSTRYDAVHAHYGPLGVAVLPLQSSGLLRGPLVTSFRGFDMSLHLRRTDLGIYNDLFERGAAFLPETAFWADRLRHLGCPPDRIRVHRNGVDLRLFEFGTPRLPENGTIRLLSVGRLVEKKGFEYALDAVRKLVADFPGLRYDIIGEGPLRGALERRIGELDLARVVTLLGARAGPQVLSAMRSADVLLAPSVTASDGDMEGLPVVLMEAMAVGLPVVSTRHSGIPELVEDGVTGYLADERDSVGLADKLRHLLAAPETWGPLAQRARAKIEANHDIARQVRNLADLYRSLRCESGPGASVGLGCVSRGDAA